MKVLKTTTIIVAVDYKGRSSFLCFLSWNFEMIKTLLPEVDASGNLILQGNLVRCIIVCLRASHFLKR